VFSTRIAKPTALATRRVMHQVQCLDLNSIDDNVALPEPLSAAVPQSAMNVKERAMPVSRVA